MKNETGLCTTNMIGPAFTSYVTPETLSRPPHHAAYRLTSAHIEMVSDLSPRDVKVKNVPHSKHT